MGTGGVGPGAPSDRRAYSRDSPPHDAAAMIPSRPVLSGEFHVAADHSHPDGGATVRAPVPSRSTRCSVVRCAFSVTYMTDVVPATGPARRSPSTGSRCDAPPGPDRTTSVVVVPPVPQWT